VAGWHSPALVSSVRSLQHSLAKKHESRNSQLTRLTQSASCFQQSGIFLFLFSVFALSERKNGKQR
jgi:hypothetical protein